MKKSTPKNKSGMHRSTQALTLIEIVSFIGLFTSLYSLSMFGYDALEH